MCVLCYLEAELLSQDAAVQRFDEYVLLHAQVQSLHRTTRGQQRLMGGRLLQLWKAARSGRQERRGKLTSVKITFVTTPVDVKQS